ncbi:hypothetical protein E2553_08380 [Paraburkholderia dipogonis]|uniref:Uncharacterized protein n=1 Tax=Paraburkholderia dipogonis TaxID=1211383 RepID=A0A4Y8N5G3_9BURK|nr:hypothetical protein [Paraburkholderia dipogonis]TFE45036.1 hypothetical protein E2553_08380 [Paraburkholderia dipogonis]
MTRSVKNQPASRPPVDALQYEKLALSAFDLCDRQVSHLETLITLASSIVRNPAITHEERKRHRTLLELLVDTAEQYQQELESDRELFQVIALDAKGIPRSRITAQHATNLLAEASQRAKALNEESNASRRKKPSTKSAMIKLSSTTAQQPSPAPH